MYKTGSWYAVRVRRDREFYVADLLKHKGYEVLLPSYRAQRQTSTGARTREVALFPGYLFCSIVPGISGGVLTTPNVISFVSCGRIPLEVDPVEIHSLRTALSHAPAQPWPYIHAGQRVRIEQGVLRGIEGVVVRVKNQFRLIISITMLQRSAAIEIDRNAISLLCGDLMVQAPPFQCAASS